MLPTCIGISGVSRYRNDASIDDSFLASAMVFLRYNKRGALVALLGVLRQSLRSGCALISECSSRLCIFRGRICNGKRPRSVKLLKFALGLRQPIGHGPEGGRIDAEPDMACQIDLDIFGCFRGVQVA